jgi:putative endonuclease
MAFTYIIKSLKDFGYYIGSARNLDDRLKRHFGGRSRATKFRLPLKLVFKKKFETYKEAYKLEQYFKKQKSKKFIEEFIKKNQSD